jgi:hypothetical protein
MGEIGYFRPFDDVRAMSSSPSIATTKRTYREVGSVPRTDIELRYAKPATLPVVSIDRWWFGKIILPVTLFVPPARVQGNGRARLDLPA